MALAGVIAPAFAQGAPDPLPSRVQGDGNGVDLVTGAFGMSATDVVIGNPGAGGLAYSRSYVGSGWRSSTFGTVSAEGATYYVSLGNSSDQFTLSGATFTSDEGAGATLSHNTITDIYTYTAADGTVAVFDGALAETLGPLDQNPGTHCDAVLTSVTAPTGAVTTYNYKTVNVSGSNETRLQSVTNSFGFMLHFDYARDTDPTLSTQLSAWRELDQTTGVNFKVDYCAPMGASCPGLSTTTAPRATYVGTTDQPTSITDPQGRTTSYTYDTSGRLTKVKWPASTVDNIVVVYNATTGRVSSVNRGFASWSYGFSDVSDIRTTTVTLPGGGSQVVTSTISTGLITSSKDPLNRTSSFLYDADGRVTRTTAPEGNYVVTSYDARGNVTQTRAVAKAGSGLADIVASATYPASCANQTTCNKPTSTTDALGKVTNYTYDATHGGVTKITAPAPALGAVRPETRFTYAQKRARYKNSPSTSIDGALTWVLSETSACATLASCAGGADETKTIIAWPDTSVDQNLQPISVTAKAGNGAVSSTTTFAYVARGWLQSIDGPLAGSEDVQRFHYTNTGQVQATIGADPDGAGPLNRPVSRTLLNASGLPETVQTGVTTGLSWNDVLAMTVLQKGETQYDVYGRPVKSILYNGATTTIESLSQVSYDSAGRPECSALRMNPALFGAPPASACSLGAAGLSGPDRVAKAVYDTAGQVLRTISAHGTTLAQDTVTSTYTTNGLVKTLKDANGNLTTYEYDGFDRLVKTRLPSKTVAGTSSTTDYVQLTFNAVGQITTRRARDARLITFTYDDLGRVTRRNVPGSAGSPTGDNNDFTYDNFGRVTSGLHSNLRLTYDYDALGRLTSRVHEALGSLGGALLAIDYQYDAAGRTTKLTHPDGFAVDYAYDLLNRPVSVKNGARTLATVAYDDHGRRQSMTYDNGTSVTYGFDGASRLTDLDWNLAGATNDFSYDFTYTPASQSASITTSDTSLVWTPPPVGTSNYTANGLNQYLDIAGTTPVYDANGNVTTDHRGQTYTYDAENQLRDAFAPDGSRLFTNIISSEGLIRARYGVSTGWVHHFYDGDQEILEFTGTYSAPTVTARYIRLPGSVDEVILMINHAISATCTTTSYAVCERWAHADRLGSVVKTTDSAGNQVDEYTYSPYGESGPEGDSGFPFRFTGQKLDPETGLYNYKARFYDPEVGRFLQTDPIGYADGMNMYAYVGNDPGNKDDPTGTEQGISAVSFITKHCYSASCELGGGGGGAGSSGGGGTSSTGYGNYKNTLPIPGVTSGHIQGGSSAEEKRDVITVTATRSVNYWYWPSTGLLNASYVGGGVVFGGRSIGERLLEDSLQLSGAVEDAWQQSNPDGPEEKRREVGFFATITWGNRPGVFSLNISGYAEGIPGQPLLNLGITPEPPQGSAVIRFHTHPFGITSVASPEDRENLPDYATGLIYSFDGYYWYGKVIP